MDHAARAKKALERLIYSPRSCDGASDAAADVDAVVAGAAADAALFSPLHELQVGLASKHPHALCTSRVECTARRLHCASHTSNASTDHN